jgi:6-phospho-beta-glucosidase
VKLTLVGAGGIRTPSACEALLVAPLSFDEIVLHDVDAERLDRISLVVDGVFRERGDRLPLRTTTSLPEAVDGADFVFCAIRPGGLEARAVDETVPLELGVVGQETTGPGGLAFALRTLPALRDIAAVVAERAPAAWFLNFTNPAGLATEALQPLLPGRVVGICDGPPSMYRGIARVLGLPPESLAFDYFGINHLGWLRAVRHDGRDLLPGLIADDVRLVQLEEGRLFGGELVRALGMIPNEYLVYYYASREVVRALREAGRTRAQSLLEQQRAFHDWRGDDPVEALELWRRTMNVRQQTYMAEAGRDGAAPGEADGGYAGVALSTMAALRGHGRTVLTLNVPNGGSMPFLDDRAVVEVPCTVDASGVAPLAVGEVPMYQRGLIEQVRAVERLVIEAVVDHRPDRAALAMGLHPLVRSLEAGRAIFDGYAERAQGGADDAGVDAELRFHDRQ